VPNAHAMGALALAIWKNKLLAPEIVGHFSNVWKKCGCYIKFLKKQFQMNWGILSILGISIK
jgi:hypothetical protein